MCWIGYKLCAICCALNQICREKKTKVKQTLDSCWCVCTCSYLIYKTSFHLCLHLLGLFWVNGVELYNMFLLSMFLHHALLACSILYPETQTAGMLCAILDPETKNQIHSQPGPANLVSSSSSTYCSSLAKLRRCVSWVAKVHFSNFHTPLAHLALSL